MQIPPLECWDLHLRCLQPEELAQRCVDHLADFLVCVGDMVPHRPVHIRVQVDRAPLPPGMFRFLDAWIIMRWTSSNCSGDRRRIFARTKYESAVGHPWYVVPMTLCKG